MFSLTILIRKIITLKLFHFVNKNIKIYFTIEIFNVKIKTISTWVFVPASSSAQNNRLPTGGACLDSVKNQDFYT